jgi:hypothetical protein
MNPNIALVLGIVGWMLFALLHIISRIRWYSAFELLIYIILSGDILGLLNSIAFSANSNLFFLKMLFWILCILPFILIALKTFKLLQRKEQT